MTPIQNIRQRLEEVGALIRERESSVAGNPDDVAASIDLASLRHHRGELQRQVRELLSERSVEVVEFRLQGKIARDGRVPLDALSEITKDLHRSLYSATAFKHSGIEMQGAVPAWLREELDIELAAVRPGSARLMVSAAIQPNLFGTSLISETLRAAFDLLHSENEEGIILAIEEIGPVAARRFRELLEHLVKRDLSLSVEWTDEAYSTHSWSGNTRKLSAMAHTLGSITSSKETSVSVVGDIETLSARGRIELRQSAVGGKKGKLFHVNYGVSMSEQVRGLRLEDTVRMHLWKTTIRNMVTGSSKVAYRLQEMEVLRRGDSE